jgi:hypothetical protein
VKPSAYESYERRIEPSLFKVEPEGGEADGVSSSTVSLRRSVN